MKIGFQSSAYDGLSLLQELQDAEERKVDFFDVFFDDFLPDEITCEEHEFMEKLSRNGMEFTVHFPIHVESLSDEVFESLIAFICRLKPKTVTVHFNVLSFSLLEKLSCAVPETTVLCVENTVPDFNPLEKMNYMEFMKEAFERFNVCSTFDVGHCNVNETEKNAAFGGKVCCVAEKLLGLGVKIATVHAHDNYGERDSHGFIGSGNVDFKSFFELLEENEQEPYVVVEHWNEREKSFAALKALV